MRSALERAGPEHAVTAELKALNPVFCGSLAPAAAQRTATSDARRVAQEESTG